MSVTDVMDEVRRRGLTEQDFRDEIRRQILEGKLIELRVRPRVHVTDQDAYSAYQHWIKRCATGRRSTSASWPSTSLAASQSAARLAHGPRAGLAHRAAARTTNS